MEVKAKLSELRMSPTKVRLVSNMVKKMDVAKAEAQLKFTNKKAAKPLAKLLKSAVANATNNHDLDEDNLYIKNILVNEGRRLKRYKPRAMGRATVILKKSSIIDLILDEKVPSKKKASAKKDAKKSTDDLKVVSAAEIKKIQDSSKAEAIDSKPSAQKPARLKGIKDKFIRRTGDK